MVMGLLTKCSGAGRSASKRDDSGDFQRKSGKIPGWKSADCAHSARDTRQVQTLNRSFQVQGRGREKALFKYVFNASLSRES